MSEFTIGQVIEVAHPFVRGTYEAHEADEDGYSSYEKSTWVPGVRMKPVYPDDCESVADAMGAQILTIISIHKPGRFPERIFYTRRWRDPNGREFGKSNLRFKTTQAFRWLARGYRHEFRLDVTPHDYDPQKDFGGSIDDCYRAVRERMAAGGPSWIPPDSDHTGR